MKFSECKENDNDNRRNCGISVKKEGGKQNFGQIQKVKLLVNFLNDDWYQNKNYSTVWYGSKCM